MLKWVRMFIAVLFVLAKKCKRQRESRETDKVRVATAQTF